MKRMIAFDLDGTLAESKQAIQEPMARLLGRLLDVAGVCVISGGDWPQFEKQVVSRLPADARIERLFIMPTTGTKLYRFEDGEWHQIYADNFSPEERDKIVHALDDAMRQAGYGDQQSWGEKIEDRGSQVTFSALGQEAPLGPKSGWDPNQEKRRKLQAILRPMLPGLSINIGGATSIDVTREGIDKAYGMRRLCEVAEIMPEEILFLGDAIYPGGNDEPVQKAGIDSVKVRDVEDTQSAVAAVIYCLSGDKQGPTSRI